MAKKVKTINLFKAKVIAGNWHSGYDSALYQFASTGKLISENESKYFNEIENHLKYSAANKKSKIELNQLRNFLIEELKKSMGGKKFGLIKTKKKAVKKTAARFVKGSKAAKDFMAKLRAKRSEGKYQYGETNKVKDKRIQAKKAGKRVAKKSKKVYYEYRANRSDIDQRPKNKGGTLLGIENQNKTKFYI